MHLEVDYKTEDDAVAALKNDSFMLDNAKQGGLLQGKIRNVPVLMLAYIRPYGENFRISYSHHTLH